MKLRICLMLNMLTAMKLPKINSVASRQGAATGQQGGARGRIISVTHEESSSQRRCCKN